MPRDRPSTFLSITGDHPVFAVLDRADLPDLLTSSRVLQYRAGHTIFTKGAVGTSPFLILAGRVRISTASIDGHEVTYALLSAGETFGEIAILHGGKRTADATALADCECLSIAGSRFVAFLVRHPEASLRLLGALARKLLELDAQLEDVLFANLRSRLARLLLDEVQSSEGRDARLKGPIFPSELATRLGAARESVSRQLSAWRHAGHLGVLEGAVTIRDVAAFRRLTGQIGVADEASG